MSHRGCTVVLDTEQEAQRVEEADVDPFLQVMVSVVNKLDPGSKLPVILFVHGTILSGALVSAPDYRAAVVGAFKSGNEGAAMIGDALANAFEEMSRTSIEEGDEGKPPPEFLHLLDVSVLRESGPNQMHGAHLRFRLSAIDGFCFGNPA